MRGRAGIGDTEYNCNLAAQRHYNFRRGVRTWPAGARPPVRRPTARTWPAGAHPPRQQRHIANIDDDNIGSTDNIDNFEYHDCIDTIDDPADGNNDNHDYNIDDHDNTYNVSTDNDITGHTDNNDNNDSDSYDTESFLSGNDTFMLGAVVLILEFIWDYIVIPVVLLGRVVAVLLGSKGLNHDNTYNVSTDNGITDSADNNENNDIDSYDTKAGPLFVVQHFIDPPDYSMASFGAPAVSDTGIGCADQQLYDRFTQAMHRSVVQKQFDPTDQDNFPIDFLDYYNPLWLDDPNVRKQDGFILERAIYDFMSRHAPREGTLPP